MYLTHRCRLAIGVELLRCNGIYLREDDARFLMREVGNSVLVNLAGNSFEMCSFISVFCMLLTLRALCAKRSFDAKLASLPSELGLRLVLVLHLPSRASWDRIFFEM